MHNWLTGPVGCPNSAEYVCSTLQALLTDSGCFQPDVSSWKGSPACLLAASCLLAPASWVTLSAHEKGISLPDFIVMFSTVYCFLAKDLCNVQGKDVSYPFLVFRSHFRLQFRFHFRFWLCFTRKIKNRTDLQTDKGQRGPWFLSLNLVHRVS